MAFNIFKKHKKEPIQPKPPIQKPSVTKKRSDISGIAYKVLRRPHITEKATDLAGQNQYIFEVFRGVNKIEVKKAIEDVYGVDVMGVKIVNIPKKKRRLGKTEGWRQGYKKAIVKIKEGQKIEVLPR